MSGRVSVPCWHATPVANAPWKPLIIGVGQARYQGHEIGGKSDWLGSHCWSRIRMSFHKESLTLSSTVILSTNFGGSKAKRISSRRARK